LKGYFLPHGIEISNKTAEQVPDKAVMETSLIELKIKSAGPSVSNDSLARQRRSCRETSSRVHRTEDRGVPVAREGGQMAESSYTTSISNEKQALIIAQPSAEQVPVPR